MKKVSILVMSAVFCAGTAAMVWADDLNPQPFPPKGTGSTVEGTHERKAGENVNMVPPDGTRQVGGNSGQNEDGDGIHTTDTHEGGKPNPGKPAGKLSPGDANQISGNLNGGTHSVNGDGKTSKGFIKGEKGYDKHSTRVKGQIGGGGGAGKGGINGSTKIMRPGEKSSSIVYQRGAGGLQKGNGLQKANGSKKGVLIGLNKANSLQKADSLQKINGLNKAGAGNGMLVPAVQK